MAKKKTKSISKPIAKANAISRTLDKTKAKAIPKPVAKVNGRLSLSP